MFKLLEQRRAQVAFGEKKLAGVESRLADWERPRVSRYTDADQQQRFPGDLGCRFAPQMVEKELVWGRA